MITAEYVDHMGHDLRVVDAARVSFSKASDWEVTRNENGGVVEKGLSEKDQKLVAYLANHNHWTPFSHCIVTMRETVPIFVARQRFKHMVGFAYNEVSRRYVSDTPEFFEPEQWRGAPTDGAKQGSSGLVGGKSLSEGLGAYHAEATVMYDSLLNYGVAPEQARMVLPQSMLTSYYVTGSLAAWARAYKLRADPHSQAEIQQLAAQWGGIIEPLFPCSWRALTNGER